MSKWLFPFVDKKQTGVSDEAVKVSLGFGCKGRCVDCVGGMTSENRMSSRPPSRRSCNKMSTDVRIEDISFFLFNSLAPLRHHPHLLFHPVHTRASC